MNDLDLVLDGWTALEPSPGFADRVLAATKTATATKPLPMRWPLVAAALAAALLLVPFLAPRSRSAPSLAHVEDLDAGLRTD